MKHKQKVEKLLSTRAEQLWKEIAVSKINDLAKEYEEIKKTDENSKKLSKILKEIRKQMIFLNSLTHPDEDRFDFSPTAKHLHNLFTGVPD